MKSDAKTVAGYLDALPPDRRHALQTVRETILKRLPKGYVETMQYGMITYVVPLTTYPSGYGGKKDVPLPYASLASQKNYMVVYLMSVYGEREAAFRTAYLATNKRLDMGKCCVRFKTLEDLPLQLIGKEVASVPVKRWIAWYEESRLHTKAGQRAAAKSAATKSAAGRSAGARATRHGAASRPRPR